MSSTTYPAFAELLKYYREKTRKTWDTIAQEAGIVKPTLTGWTTKGRPRDVNDIAKLAAVFRLEAKEHDLLLATIDTRTQRGTTPSEILQFALELAAREKSLTALQGWARTFAESNSILTTEISRPTEQLKQEAQKGKLYGVDDLPRFYMPRTDLLTQLREFLLAQQVICVSGMAGIGKTVLVAALVREDSVQRMFPDGVFWIRFGQEPSLVARQNELLQALSGSYGTEIETLHAHQPPTLDEQYLRNRLSALFAERRILIVLDDVWDAKVVRNFCVPSQRWSFIITSRNQRLADDLSAYSYPVPLLEDKSALELLARYAKVEPVTLPVIVQDILQYCQNLPLSIAAVGGSIRGRPERWNSALERLKVADIGSLQLPIDYPHQNIFRSIQASIDALSEDAQKCYHTLVVTPNGAAVPLIVVHQFWRAKGYKQFTIDEVTDTLIDSSLISYTANDKIHIHSVFLDYLREHNPNPESLHYILIDSYSDDGATDWTTIQDDGYFYKYLIYHLIQAGQVPEVVKLLNRVEWLQAHLMATNIYDLLSDYDLLFNPRSKQLNDGEIQSLQLIREALRLAAGVLVRDKTQLISQLIGRLSAEANREVQLFLDQARTSRFFPALQPMMASLHQPGEPLIHTLYGHRAGIQAVTFYLEGKRAISASDDHDLKIWDLNHGSELGTLKGHTKWVRHVVVTPDNRYAVSGAEDRTLRIWDLNTFSEVRVLNGHEAPIRGLAVIPDGSSFISASEDRTLRLWDLSTGETLQTLHGHVTSVRSVQVLRDGQRAVSGADDGMILLWDLKSGERLSILRGHEDSVLALAVDPKNQYVVSASRDGKLRIWDIATLQPEIHPVRHLIGHADAVRDLAFIGNDQIISVSKDRSMRIWDVMLGTELTMLSQIHGNTVYTIAISPDCTRALTAADDCLIRLWDLSRLGTRHTSSQHGSSIAGLAISYDGVRAASSAKDGSIRVWDQRSGTVDSSLRLEQPVTALALVPSKTVLIIGTSSGRLYTWDWITGSQYTAPLVHYGAVTQIRLSREGDFAVTTAKDGTLTVWESTFDNFIPHTSFTGEGPIIYCEISDDGHTVIAGEETGRVHILSLLDS
jgi:WD40 repeat protein/transcriptional regulator with XRE-family HTH domain